MKRPAFFFALILLYLGAVGTSFGQGCEVNVVGTWKIPTAAGQIVLYRFASDGSVTALSTSGSTPDLPQREIGRAVYELDQSTNPKSIVIVANDKGRVFGSKRSVVQISEYDGDSFLAATKGSSPVRWTKVNSARFFIVLAARRGTFYNGSGPAFPILMKKGSNEIQMVAVGTYSDQGTAAFGAVPPATYEEFMREARSDSEVVLRLEINSAQYDRSLKILRTWERRANENALLYPAGDPLNNVLLVKAVTETLNQCGEALKLYNLNYIHPEDWISNQYSAGAIPFVYFKELRRLNESLHLTDDKFQTLTSIAALAGKKSEVPLPK